MKNERWFLVIPPEGAARTVARHTADAFSKRLPPENIKIFDTATYKNAYTAMLRSPDENMVIDLLNQSLAISCLDFQASYCFVPALSPVTLFTLNVLRKHTVTTAHWFFEDHFKAHYWKQVLSGYDHFFAIQKGVIETACRELHIPFHFLSTASTLSSLNSHSAQRVYDISFIGLPSSYRITFLEALVQRGFRVCIAGSGWSQYRGILESSISKKTWINEEESFNLLQQSIAGLNLSFDDPSLRGDVHISPRVYDICAAKCHLLTEDVPLFREAFPDVTASLFTDITDAASRLEALLEISTDSDKTLEKNRECVMRSHMYANRVDSIITAMMKE